MGEEVKVLLLLVPLLSCFRREPFLCSSHLLHTLIPLLQALLGLQCFEGVKRAPDLQIDLWERRTMRVIVLCVIAGMKEERGGGTPL